MKTLSFFILFLTSVTCKENTATKVYLCNSEGGKKYHYKSNCCGLSNCQHKIIATTLDKAKGQGKTLCGWEK